MLVTAPTGCSKISKGVKVTSSCLTVNAGVFENMKQLPRSIFVYPNPSDGRFTLGLKLNSNTVSALMEVFNVLGKKVHSELIYLNNGQLKKQIGLQNTLKSGIYTLRITSDSAMFSKNIIIQQEVAGNRLIIKSAGYIIN